MKSRSIILFLSLFTLRSHAQEDLNIAKRLAPSAQTASTVGNWALWHNPSGLAFLGGAESGLGYLHEWSERGNLHHGYLNTAFNLWKVVSFGAGLSARAAFSDEARARVGGEVGGIVGAAVKLSSNTAFGLSLWKSHNFLRQQANPWLFAFGFQMRPFKFMSVGGHYEEVNRGFFSAADLVGGISIRPHKEYLTISLDGRLKAKGKEWGDGFAFAPKLSLSALIGGYGASVSAEIPKVDEGFKDPIFAFSFDLNLENIGLGFAGHLNPSSRNYSFGSRIRASSEDWESIVKPRGLFVELTIDSDGSLYERRSLTDRLFSPKADPLSVLSLLRRIEMDPRIGGVVLNLIGFSFGNGRAQEWHEAILSLRRANKEVFVYLDSPTERDYYVAIAANRILMNKNATLSLRNFQATLVYFADMLKKIGIKADAVAAGKYKTAPRQWTSSSPRGEEVEVANNILNDFYQTLIEKTAERRDLYKVAIEGLLDQGEITAEKAKTTNLVDDLIDAGEAVMAVGRARQAETPFFGGYQGRRRKQESWHPPKKIAVIPISDVMVDGRVSPGILAPFFPMTGAKDVTDEIEAAVSDPEVIGIIMRINSPGGDAMAGSKINHALNKARQAKPVVTSMSDVAASAGYMAAAGTDHILALPNTITGSIGVFSLMFSAEGLSKNIGINKKELSPLKNPGPNMFRTWTEAEKRQAQGVVDWYYRSFIDTVAAGLKVDKEEIKKNADGRVWLGHEALAKKLVHQIGGFSEAVESIRRLAQIPEDEEVVVEIRAPGIAEQFSLTPKLLSALSTDALRNNLKELLPLVNPYARMIECYRLSGLPQARLPFDIEWRSKGER